MPLFLFTISFYILYDFLTEKHFYLCQLLFSLVLDISDISGSSASTLRLHLAPTKLKLHGNLTSWFLVTFKSFGPCALCLDKQNSEAIKCIHQ